MTITATPLNDLTPPRSPRRPPYWICHPRTPTCRNFHPYVSFRENENRSVIDFRGGDSWMLLTCGKCGTHAFGVQSAHHELLHMYDITAEQLDKITEASRTTPAWVILEAVGYLSKSEAG